MRPISRLIFRAILPIAVLHASPPGAEAQMVLPGAVAPTPEGATVSPEATGTRRPKPRPRAAADDAPRLPAAPGSSRTPAPGALAGQTLYLNGRKSQVVFQAQEKALAVSRLLLTGERPSNSREECQVEVAGAPIATTDLGKPNGLSRIQLAVPACPIAFDVLDGAALAVGDPPSCEFKEQNCRVTPAGLWGPQPGALGPDKAKGLEHARAQADSAVRTDFKLLLSTTKDRSAIIGYAREQAGFSSAREEICRDYAGESRHGFCAARLTEARAAALRAKYEEQAAHKPPKKARRAR